MQSTLPKEGVIERVTASCGSGFAVSVQGMTCVANEPGVECTNPEAPDAAQRFVARSNDSYRDLVAHVCAEANGIVRPLISPERAFANVSG